MRLAFMGTPDFAVPTLEALAAARHEIAAVYCQPPRPAGRGKGLRPSPVQQRAEAMGIEVRMPVSLRDPDVQHQFAALGLDAAIVAAYGLILPQPILDSPRLGCLNVHASLLPRWRGAAPIQRAILAGDSMTGVTIMRMEAGLDTGPMMAVMGTPVGRKTAGELTDELARLGSEWMVEVLASIDRIGPREQNEACATYAPKIRKEEARLDFTRHALEVDRQVRAFNPMPGAWFEAGGERFRLLAVDPVDVAGEPGIVLDEWLTIACGVRGIVPTLLQRSGRAPMSGADLLRGFPIPPGTKLG